MEPVEIELRMDQNVSEESEKATGGIDHITRSFEQLTKRVEQDSESMGNTLGSLAKKIGIVFGIGQLKSFMQQVIAVRSEFQNTEASFKVFLGSAEKAASFMKEMQSYAFNNVFEFKDLTKNAAQLLAYQHSYEDIIPIIDKLSNVAAGANVPLEQLVDLYNKAKSQGKLMTQDIMQWQRAGVPVIQTLAKELGKTEEAIRDMVSSGSIGFKEIDSVLNAMTSSGGMFAGMMTEKMKTLGDSVGLLQDSITAMMNEIGEKSQGVLRGGILAVNALVENYEKVGKVLLGLIAMYGTYKAAVAIVTITQNVATAATAGYISPPKKSK